MKYARNFVIALCASIATFGIVSCVPDDPIVQDNSQFTVINKFGISVWNFENGVSEREMIVGDSLMLPEAYSWKSDNETVATVVEEDSVSWLKAVGVGTATVSDENAKLKINVTVKAREQ